MGLDSLHQQGYTGDSVKIAIIDIGFYRADTHFASHIVDTFDLLPDTLTHHPYKGIYADSNETHGTCCLSTILGDSVYEGTAPGAQFYLFRTEDWRFENRAEVDRLARAIYMADSLDVDVITISLGYGAGHFNDPTQEYPWSALNGTTTPVAIAASDVGQRRIICVAMGNDGADTTKWYHLATPADAFHILSVGALDSACTSPASFSSYGPTADGRRKPEVSAWGQRTRIWNPSTGRWSRGNGTSFATPEMAGLMACLRQARPDLSPADLRDAVIRSASRYTLPDSAFNYQMGYGVPNAAYALRILSELHPTWLTSTPQQAERGIKFLRNGVIYIRRGEHIYTLSGQRL